MTEKKLKISEGTIARLIGDLAALAEKVDRQERVIQLLEAQVALQSVKHHADPVGTWWKNPIVSFQGRAVRDAGEQAAL